MRESEHENCVPGYGDIKDQIETCGTISDASAETFLDWLVVNWLWDNDTGDDDDTDFEEDEDDEEDDEDDDDNLDGLDDDDSPDGSRMPKLSDTSIAQAAINAILMGKPGVGKTALLSSFLGSEVFDFDNKIKSASEP